MRTIGRYLLAGPIATGGMASVHLGKLSGPVGFRRTVAIKRMLQTFAANPEARAMLVDEARMTARVSHPNVVQLLDVVEEADELFLVLEYVQGESLDRLLARCRAQGVLPPARVTAAILTGVLRGLHAAHEARGEDGQLLELVHRDLSPHNILVDVHGVAMVLDFGVARARGRLQATQDGQLKGKLAYLAPEQVHGDTSRRSDLFTAGVVLWECLSGKQLFEGTSEADLLSKVLLCKVPPLAVDPALQAVLARALDREPERRFATAAEMADALEQCGTASAAEVAAFVAAQAAEALQARAKMVEELERLPVEPTPSARPAAGQAERSSPVHPERSRGVRASPGTIALLWGSVVAVALALGTAAYFAGDRAIPAPVTVPAPVAVTPPPPPPAPAVVEPARPTAPPKAIGARKPAPAPPPAPACDPPFVIDAAGVKRFKPDCLR